ncbi:MAG: hypothetical protein KDK97_00455 [Verrucomicrobiales bacterium]|nr:hypothetical protein [Verrucomicrobiales bacterium]MCP5560119.1 hypothetical protein [Verrucomicrobiaceae bacterium]
MCCFSGKVKEVKNTRIFARMGAKGHQVIVYQMSIHAPEDLAMVLPIPVTKGSDEKVVQFFDFSGYPQFFADLGKLFPTSIGAAGPFGVAPPRSMAPKLKVVSVGAYDASFVPTIKDFSRLDERFRLPEGVWDQLPGYSDFGFAVFKLKAGHGKVHPMAFAFPSATPKKLFFPTLHIHDGKVHDKEAFDHVLYFQGDRAEAAHGGWVESPALAVTKVKCGLTHDMVRPERHVYRQTMRGTFQNGDVVVALA